VVSRVRILFTVHQFLPEHYAGTEMMTLALAGELKARGHEPHILAAKRSIPGSDIAPGEVVDYEVDGIPVRRVGRPREGAGRPYALEYRNRTMAERTRQYVEEIKPDLVHVMHLQGLSASVIPVFKEFNLPVLYMPTDYWAVCPVVDLRRHDGAMCTGPELHHCVQCLVSRQPPSRARTLLRWTPDWVLRAVGKVAGTDLARRSHTLRQVRALRERPAELRARIALVDRVMTQSRFVRDILMRNGVAVDGIEVSPYGIDARHISRVPRDPGVPRPLRIGFIGTLAPHKGCDVLIQAFRQLPSELDATLTIHGSLERFKRFVKLLRELAEGDERITFAGPFPASEAGRVLSELDVVVVPSRWYENAPLVIHEAFSAGVPVVATNLGGMAEAVEAEKNGLLFELEDATDLARQLRRLGEEDGLLDRLRAGTEPAKTIQEEADEMEALYASLLSENGRSRPALAMPEVPPQRRSPA
jgi:glycosyltransferase involved in cell wall biosynthesis